MSNKQAVWRNDTLITAVEEWWTKSFPQNDASVHNTETYGSETVGISHLYQRYYEWTLPYIFRDLRLSEAEFAKCLTAVGVLDIGGRWRRAKDWKPRADFIRRITASGKR